MNYRIFESDQAKEEKATIYKTFSQSQQQRLINLLKNIADTPFSGTGKPELLKWELAGKWSRRFTDKHRIIYYVKGNEVHILSYLSHYQDK